MTGTNFSENVTLSATGQPSGVTVTFNPSTIATTGADLSSQATSTMTVDVDSGVTADNSTITVTATGTGVTTNQQLALTVTEPPVTIDTVAIQGFGGSTQVRQGFGAIVLEITGNNLNNIALANLNGLAGTVQTNNNLAATIQFTVPTGEAIGSNDLSITADAGNATFSNAVEVTAITANAATGSDTNLGTPDSPFKTLTQAASVAGTGDSINLADGLYDTANGETFPIDISDVSLSGTTEAGTIVDGTGVANTDGLVINSGTSAVSNLTVQNLDLDGIDINGGTVTVSNVTVTEVNQDAFETSDATVTLTDVTATNSDDGIEANTGSVLTLTNFTASGNQFDGIDLDNDTTATIDTVSLTNNGDNGIEISSTVSATITNATISGSEDLGIDIQNALTVQISNSTVNNNGSVTSESGIEVSGTATVTLDNVTANNNNASGLEIDGTGSSTTVTNSTFQNNGDHGVEVDNSPAVVNLGDATTTGNNTINNNVNFQISDDRPAGETVIITSFGNDLGGAGAPLNNLFTGATTQGNCLEITGAGNQVEVRP